MIQKYSHMPFFCRLEVPGEVLSRKLGLEVTGEKIPFTWLLFCGDGGLNEEPDKQRYRMWKLHAMMMPRNGTLFYGHPSFGLVRIHTGFDGNEVECSPCCYQQDGLIHISFILGRWTAEKYKLNLYKVIGKNFVSMSDPIQICPFPISAGFEWKGVTYFSLGDERIWRSTDGKDFSNNAFNCGLRYVIRLSPLFEDEKKILITGSDKEDESDLRTVLLDMETGRQTEVKTSSGEMAYKPSMIEGALAYVKRGDQDMEQHMIEIEGLKDDGQS